MITIEEKLYITKEVNQIIVKYAKQVLLKNLLRSYSFEDCKTSNKLTSLIGEVHSFCPERPIRATAVRLADFCSTFLDRLSKDDQVAIHFWTINYKYDKYLENEESLADYELEEDLKHRAFEEKFGRELAQKIYDPKGTELESDCIGLMTDYLFSFTDQLDLSLIDGDTVFSVLEQIEMDVWVQFKNYRNDFKHALCPENISRSLDIFATGVQS